MVEFDERDIPREKPADLPDLAPEEAGPRGQDVPKPADPRAEKECVPCHVDEKGILFPAMKAGEKVAPGDKAAPGKVGDGFPFNEQQFRLELMKAMFQAVTDMFSKAWFGFGKGDGNMPNPFSQLLDKLMQAFNPFGGAKPDVKPGVKPDAKPEAKPFRPKGK